MKAAAGSNFVEERRERKRLQNRLNQRAHRQRIKDEADAHPKSHKPDKTPYHIDCWRLVQHPRLSAQASRPAVLSSGQAINYQQIPKHGDSQTHELQAAETRWTLPGLEPNPPQNSDHSLPADHVLIHLIIHNVTRGFMYNKNVLRLMANFVTVSQYLPLHPELAAGCEMAIVRPTHQIIPHCLLPTQLQMSTPHPTWMDMIPFPEIRDNLIRRQHNFNHKNFLKALVGDLVYIMSPPGQGKAGLDSIPSLTRHWQQDRSLSRRDREGFILWGEPYLKESWEATPLFLAKWPWVVEGCHELIDISNKWRVARGEDILCMPTS
ncbi:uncharacterized protein BKA55DRAFT_583607 [Fusarium redolens]|uniref:BZIP domain-containing protein n=1 Tax=Fusarium redolens TaxID=48865 RepID=A0A9P9G2S8_FUSRE|nr:uncharacterized protein BKA55DRAFT_583607 [Fusarium redolens]KAH7230212.1 hypothetical protein BKA55DRAFT_583607 [Fusarium redolens]